MENHGVEEIEKQKEDVYPVDKKKEWLQAFKYLCFAASAGLIQFGSDALMVSVFHWAKWVSYLIALILSVLWNFTFNRKFTFHSASNIPIAMLKVVLYYAIFTPASVGWTYGLCDLAHWNSYLVLAITMIINLITEFLYQKYYVFKK